MGRPLRQIWARRRFSWLSSLGDVEEFDGQP
ncbi:Uncharacterised protein [Bordetella pertussis]|nr:Uncharacterised protein [Bordetella pertussis]